MTLGYVKVTSESPLLNGEVEVVSPSQIKVLAAGIAVVAGPVGPQGPAGTPGVAGPVGPAGLEWQGAWVSGTSYVADDAVGFGGASYFCINPTH
jgi:hypothetical protein